MEGMGSRGGDGRMRRRLEDSRKRVLRRRRWRGWEVEEMRGGDEKIGGGECLGGGDGGDG